MAGFNTISEVEQYLLQIPMFGNVGAAAARFGTEGITLLCDAIGNPQHSLRTIHVAGTNGKGSVCHLLHAVYSAAGYRTGVYTSPHLIRFNERFVINNREISDDELLLFFQRYGDVVKELSPTYFELSTAIAFWYFAEKNTDLAIIETGLGGRLDATNIINPLCSIITSIGLDHTDVLGETISEIAFEKAGIIKQNKSVILGKLPDEARKVITDRALKQHSEVFYAAEPEPGWDKGRIMLGEESRRREYQTEFHQPVQRYNLAMVRKAVDLLGEEFPVAEEDFVRAIQDASVNGIYRARFERLIPGRDWYFDGAHNTEAFGYSLDLCRELAGNRKKILVFSIMRDKLRQDLISLLLQFDELYYFESNLKRAACLKEVSALMPETKRLNGEGWNSFHARISAESPFILFSGSLYFYSRIRDYMYNSD